jgi:hypothetical protein
LFAVLQAVSKTTVTVTAIAVGAVSKNTTTTTAATAIANRTAIVDQSNGGGLKGLRIYGNRLATVVEAQGRFFAIIDCLAPDLKGVRKRDMEGRKGNWS